MKKLLNMRYSKHVVLGVLFIISSILLFSMDYLLACVVTSYGRGILTFLPTMIAVLLPAFTLASYWTYLHKKNEINKWRVLRNYSLITLLTSTLALILHVVMIIVEFGWKLGSLTYLFPFDVLCLLMVFVVLGVLSLIKTIKMKKNITETTDEEKIKTRTVVAAWFMIGFASYYFGGTLSSVTLFTNLDANWFGMIPALLSLSLLTLMLVMFFIYKHAKEENKQKAYKRGLLITGITTVVLYGLVLDAVLINSRLFPESLSNFFVLGFAIKIPIGFLLNFVGVITLFVIALVKYIKRYIKKK